MSELVDRLRKKYLQEEIKENKNSDVVIDNVQQKAEAIRNGTYLPIKHQSNNTSINRTSARDNQYNFQNFVKSIKENPDKIISIANRGNTLLDTGRYLTKEAVNGAQGGIAGIQDAYATKFANAIDKGQKKNAEQVLNDSIRSLTNLISPAVGITLDSIEHISDLASKKDFGKTTMNQLTRQTDKLAGLDMPLNVVQTIGNILPRNEGNKLKESLLNSTNWYEEESKKMQEEREKQNKIVQTIGSATNSAGRVLPSIAATAVTKDPNVGLTMMGVSAAGSSTREAINEGADLEKAVDVGTAKALVEVGTEKIFGGIDFFGKGALDDIFTKNVKKKVTSKVGKFLLQQGYDIGGEIIEENISNFAGYGIDKIILDKDLPTFKQILDDASETTLTTFLSTVILKGLGATGNVINKKQVLQQAQEENGKTLSVKEKEDISKLVDILEKNDEKGIVNNANITQTQQATQVQNKMAQNQTSQQINTRFIETAKKNNIDINTEDIKTIDRVLTDRGIQGEFNSNLFTNSSQSALWRVGKDAKGNTVREVVFNPKADTNKTIQNLTVHEMLHDFEGADTYKQLKELVLDFDETKSGYEESRKSLTEAYSKVYDKDATNFNELIENEIVADILGNKLGNQEFVNNLTTQNRTLGQRIYYWVVDKLNKINKLTGYKNEKIYWADVKSKFENAFKQKYQGNNNNTKYSVIYNDDGSFNKVRITDNIFENSEGKSIKKTIKDYLTQHIGEYADIIESGQRVYLGEDLPNEYAYSEYSKKLPTNRLLAKGRASSNLQEIIENASNRQWSKNKKAKHNQDAKYGFYKYDTKFSFDVNGGEQNYSATVLIRNDVSGKKYLYDILNIKKIGNNLPSIASDFNKSSYRDGSNSLPINNIASSNENVNTTTEYSMQNEQNNAWQEYLDKNYKNTGSGKTVQELKLPTKQSINEQQEIDAELNKIYNKKPETAILPQTKILDKYNSNKRSIKKDMDAVVQKTVNKGHYIDKLAKKTGNNELTYKYDRMLNAQAEGQYTIGVAQTDNNGKVIGKSVNDIWKPAEEAGLVKKFSEYLLHKHNIAREGQNKAIFGNDFTSSQSRTISENFERDYPQFKEWAKDVYKYNQNNLENMVDAGLITKETKEFLNEMYPNYVTISRQVDEVIKEFSNEKTGTNNPLKRAKFASADIKPLKDSMAEQAIKIKKLVRTNEVGLELRNALKNSEVKTNYDETCLPSELFSLDTVVESDNQGKKYCTVFENGLAKKIQINDEIYQSLKPSVPYDIEKTLPLRAVQKISNIHKALLTSDNPIFVVTNFYKDFQDGMFNSKYSSKFIKNYAKAIKQIIAKGEIYNQYMANGGGNNTYFDYNTGVKREGGKISKFVNKIRNVNELVEQAPRLAEYISTIEDGKTINEALYNAAEVTTNFKRGGDITKALNRNGAEFLNASIQGFSKQYRNLIGQNGLKGYVNLLAKATALGVAPAILNHMLLKDDEDYEDLPESTKDLYYLFKCKDNTFIRIPKGRVLSIFGAVARRTLESLQGQDDAFEGLGSTVVNQMAPNNPLEDNILAPIIQVKNNKTWYGSDLVPQRLQSELPKNQYDEKTDNFSRFLGEKLNVSPIKINYLLDQYSGGVGDILLPMITPEAKENVLVDKFTTNSVLKNKNVSKFFNTIEKQTQITNDTEVSDKDMLKMKYLNSRKSETSELYKEKRQIQMSNISNEEKKNKVQEIQEKINTIVVDALEKYNDVKIDKNSAIVADKKYYKNNKENWQELSEEEETKNKNISLKTYSDYKDKVYSKKEELIKKGTIKSTGDVPNTEKSKILANSNYSDKEKLEIYCNYIGTQDKKVKLVVKSGVSINEYLKFKSQDFEAEKDAEGNIIKKKKDKVYQYLNENNTSPISQRAIFLKMEGYNEYNGEIIKYIKNSKLSVEEQKELLEILGFKIDENGRISWTNILPLTKYK